MFQPVKEAFGRYMAGFFRDIVPTTKSLKKYVKRELPTAIAYAPSRMVDAANDMFIKYLRADVKKGLGACDYCQPATTSYEMPMILIAISQDVTPTARDYTHQVTDRLDFTFPEDPKKRVFKLREVANDLRAQVVFFSHDEPTARSMAAQFLLYLDEIRHRTFYAEYEFAGFKTRWPCQIENPEIFTPSMASNASNMVVLASDVTLKCSVPIFYAPKKGEPHDGKGTPGGLKNPSGYPVVKRITTSANGVEVGDAQAKN